MDADHEALIRQRLERAKPYGSLFGGEDWRKRYPEDVQLLLDTITQERSLRESAERIASDMHSELLLERHGPVARAEARAEVLAFVREWINKWNDVARISATQNQRLTEDACIARVGVLKMLEGWLLGKDRPTPPEPPPHGAILARLAEALAALDNCVELCGRFLDREPQEAHFDSYETDHADARRAVDSARDILARAKESLNTLSTKG